MSKRRNRVKRFIKLTLPLVLTSLTFASECKKLAPVEEPCYTQAHFHEYHNRIAVFGPLHQVYERTKTDAFYVGVETWYMPVISTGNGHNSNHWIGEAELRMGFNYFYNGRDHVTPFLGVGAFKDFGKEEEVTRFFRNGVIVRRERRSDVKSVVLYGVFGLLYDHEFTSVFNLGLTVKGIVGGPVNDHKHINWGSPVGGIDVSLPITFRFGYKKRWDIRLEPFDIYLHGTRISRNYFGGRSTVGFRF
jgi:hypothetical protein